MSYNRKESYYRMFYFLTKFWSGSFELPSQPGLELGLWELQTLMTNNFAHPTH